MNIVVVGIGYVGLSMAVLLSQKFKVTAVDIDSDKVKMVNNRISPIADKEIEDFLRNKKLSLIATTDIDSCIKNANIVIIATPTDYDPKKHYFNTSSVDNLLKLISKENKDALIVIKSTIPIGYVNKSRKELQNKNIIFSPEFLREGKALYDNLYPTRIVIGEQSERAEMFAKMLKDCSYKQDVKKIYVNPKEAESIKLFANTYLALRISFFNELDTFAEINGLNTEEIIRGVSSDPRIGDFYNNPSFGYGGYCLPKDTKQLLANYGNIKNSIIHASVTANEIRKEHIVSIILSKKPEMIGIYRLTMKKDSDNYRSSAIQDIMLKLIQNGMKVQIYEPTYNKDKFNNITVNNNFENFVTNSSLILANRIDDELINHMDKVYTRDVLFRD